METYLKVHHDKNHSCSSKKPDFLHIKGVTSSTLTNVAISVLQSLRTLERSNWKQIQCNTYFNASPVFC